MPRRPTDPYVHDPAYSPKDAAKYFGCKDKRTLRAHGVRSIVVHRSKDGKHDREVYLRSDLNAALAAARRRPAP